MPIRLFVYGTLKQGFPNHHLNGGQRIPGTFRTHLRFPLLVVRLPNEDRAPWLMQQPGAGFQVSGQVFEVDDAALPAIDALEEVGLPTGYVRECILLEDAADPARQMQAHAYLKPTHHLQHCLAHEGPFAAYTLALAEGYWLRAAGLSVGDDNGPLACGRPSPDAG
jgi:gamma-glutamylaminecyclotransferase